MVLIMMVMKSFDRRGFSMRVEQDPRFPRVFFCRPQDFLRRFGSRMKNTNMRSSLKGHLDRKMKWNRRRLHCSVNRNQHLMAYVEGNGGGFAEQKAGKNVVEWLVQYRGTLPECPKIVRKYVGEESGGYGLIATEDIEPGETILSVPLDNAFTSQTSGEESDWSIDMVEQFLVTVGKNEEMFSPWVSILPEVVNLPWLYWRDEDIDELQDRDTIREIMHLKQIHKDCIQLLRDRYSERIITWALSLIHSRSFIYEKKHVWVPGIDLCNHSWTPNANVRYVHSPDAVQGFQALEEIAPTRGDGRTGLSRFELVAGEIGVAKGDQIFISYGNWPNDVLLLFFGWVDDSNPNESVVLFDGMDDLLDFYERAYVKDERNPWRESCTSYAEVDRMAVTCHGCSTGLMQGIQRLIEVSKAGETTGIALDPSDLIRSRCIELLNSYPKSLEDDVELIQQEQKNNGDLKTAIRYRKAKKLVLRTVVEQLS